MTQAEKLRDVVKHAFEMHYRGEGHGWGMHKHPEKIQEAYDTGDWNRVLRSQEFCRHFWAVRLFAQTLVPSVEPTIQSVSEREATAWQRQHAAIQAVDNPIDYCYEHANDLQ
jgi:hypothetical protein